MRILLLFAVLAVAGCESRDVRTDLAVVDVRTGWYDVGITQAGENKLVPSVSFKLRNISDEAISGVPIIVSFRSLGDDTELSQHLLGGIRSQAPLEPGSTTDAIVARADYGFTSTASRADMLQHSQFVDARVRILGRHGRNNWTPLGQYDVDRELLTE